MNEQTKESKREIKTENYEKKKKQKPKRKKDQQQTSKLE